jgi:hypothetical protein
MNIIDMGLRLGRAAASQRAKEPSVSRAKWRKDGTSDRIRGEKTGEQQKKLLTGKAEFTPTAAIKRPYEANRGGLQRLR